MRLVDVDSTMFWDILFDEAQVEGCTAKRISDRLNDLSRETVDELLEKLDKNAAKMSEAKTSVGFHHNYYKAVGTRKIAQVLQGEDVPEKDTQKEEEEAER